MIKEKSITAYNIDLFLKKKKSSGNKRVFLSNKNWDLLYNLVGLNGFSDCLYDNFIIYLGLKIFNKGK